MLRSANEENFVSTSLAIAIVPFAILHSKSFEDFMDDHNHNDLLADDKFDYDALHKGLAETDPIITKYIDSVTPKNFWDRCIDVIIKRFPRKFKTRHNR